MRSVSVEMAELGCVLIGSSSKHPLLCVYAACMLILVYSEQSLG